MSCHSLLAWSVSIERSAVILIGIPLCVICCFSLAAFNICSLCLIFVNLINMCLEVFQLGFILFGSLWVSWTWVIIFFPILGKFSTIISSSIFSLSFFLSSSGTAIIQCWSVSYCPGGLWDCPHFFQFVFLFSSLIHLFLPFIFYFTNPIFCLHYSDFLAPKCFWSHLLHYSFYIDSFYFF